MNCKDNVRLVAQRIREEKFQCFGDNPTVFKVSIVGLRMIIGCVCRCGVLVDGVSLVSEVCVCENKDASKKTE